MHYTSHPDIQLDSKVNYISLTHLIVIHLLFLHQQCRLGMAAYTKKLFWSICIVPVLCYASWKCMNEMTIGQLYPYIDTISADWRDMPH